jgi:hypothetical protein
MAKKLGNIAADLIPPRPTDEGLMHFPGVLLRNKLRVRCYQPRKVPKRVPLPSQFHYVPAIHR